MTENSNIPSIRFAGFTDPWEQRKVEEVVSEVSRPVVLDDDKLYQLVTVRRRNEGVASRGYLKGKDILVKSYFEIHAGDYLISKRQIVHGANGYVPESLDNAVVSNEYLVIVGNENISTAYWSLISQRREMYRMFMLSSYGVDIEKLVFNVDDWKKRILRIPAVKEQQQLIGFFSHLDDLITLHQRKYDKLVVFKKAMLEQMFPQEGETVPKIRFAGFTDPWEQRKLGDYLTLSRVVGHTGLNARKLTVKLWGKGVVEKTDSYGGSASTQYFIRHAGQFMYGKLDFLHAAFGIVPEKLDGYESTLDSPAFDMSGIDSLFLLNRVTQQDFYLRNGMIANGSRKAKRIHEDTFLDMSVLLPSLAEQQAIGRFFSHLDDLITLHQRKLELLRNIKKSLLDKMFV
ncbi:restriction endonuclease subunit S [Bifidobacterium callitrichos]|uniref:Restriction endonuclease subunit S n=1 Tax=Bifidobacterium callitrichos TaxID=762209 RepID=A0A2T3GDE0_9BIFI|nr:restriction endonuclease subunit S [Bifidobacterium callitrichos]